jgi:hypothetical protein
MEIPRGVQLAVQALCRMLQIDPVLMLRSVENIDKSLHSVAADMATIRRQNSAIMSHLGIAETLTTEHDNGQSTGRTLNGGTEAS